MPRLARLVLLSSFAAVGAFAIAPPARAQYALVASCVGGAPPAPGTCDPCWVTYSVVGFSGGAFTNPSVAANVAAGLMVPLPFYIDVPWQDANSGLRLFGRYFEDEPDGTVKLVACEPDPDDGPEAPPDAGPDGDGTPARPAQPPALPGGTACPPGQRLVDDLLGQSHCE